MSDKRLPDPMSGFCHWPSTNDPEGSHDACPRTAENCECVCHREEKQ